MIEKAQEMVPAFFSQQLIIAPRSNSGNCNGNEDSLECSFHETEKKNYIGNRRVVFIKFFYHEVKNLKRKEEAL
jgi:hypothetical protein